MKKTSIGLALLAITGAASAQSSVTLFGVLDAGVSYYNTKSSYFSPTPAVSRPTVTISQTVLQGGQTGYVPSRLGFRGQEDLGGGLAASFWLEGQMSVNDGATPILFSRRSTVSLSNFLGEIRLGRDFTPNFWSDTFYDPFNNWGVGANLIGSINARLAIATALPGGGLLNGGLPGGPDNYVHTSNAIGYFMPKGLGGFYGQLMYAFPEGTKNSLQPNTPSQRAALDAARFGWQSGKFDISGSYQVSTPIDAVAPFTSTLLDTKLKTASLGSSYDFGVVKVSGELSRATNDSDAAIPFAAAPLRVAIASTSVHYDGALAGFSVPFGASTFKAAYSYVKYSNDVATAYSSNQDASASKISIGYTYNLSKRTLLYATAAYVKIRNGQNNSFVMGAPTGNTTPSFVTTATSTSAGYAPSSSLGYDFGINHAF